MRGDIQYSAAKSKFLGLFEHHDSRPARTGNGHGKIQWVFKKISIYFRGASRRLK
jgi:hypothetical protein